MDESMRVAVITGAGSGVGRAVALELLTAGYHVALAGRRTDALEETASLSATTSDRTLTVPTDVSQPESVRALFDQVRNAFRRVDLLFNNAGASAAGDVAEVSYDEWTGVVGVNLTGSFLCAHEAFRIMREQQPSGGRIINNGSLSAHTPRPNSVAYTTTKHAITGLTKSIALDGRKYNIACGQIDIGNAETPMTQRMSRGVPQASGEIMVEPTIDVDHVARAVRYMAELPLDANVPFLTVMATRMPFLGRG